MKKIISKTFLFLFASVVCLSPFLALAQTTPDTGGGDYADNEFVQILDNVKNFLLSFGGILAILFIIAGALLLTAGGGDTKRIETGKSMIVWAIIGLAIIFMASAIVTTVQQVISPAT